MQRKDSSIVSIDYDFKTGLIFKWNFNGYLSSTYFRHIVILDVDGSFPISDFIESYYSKIKPGDMISFGFIDANSTFLLSGWKEKNPLTEIQYKKFSPVMNKLQNLAQSISQIDQEMRQLEEPMILNILSQRSHHQIIDVDRILKQFIEKKKNYSANIFCHSKTSINFSTGVNVLNLNDMKNCDGWSFFKSYLSQIALLRVKIIIQCENGSISSQKKEEWKSVDFNRIERELKMPTVNYLQDILEFLNHDLKEEINYLLNIKLEFQELNQKCYQAQKSISIKMEKQKTYPKTMANHGSHSQGYDLTLNLKSFKDPYQSKTIIWFAKQIEQDLI